MRATEKEDITSSWPVPMLVLKVGNSEQKPSFGVRSSVDDKEFLVSRAVYENSAIPTKKPCM